jgi:hypothetical protein
VQKAERCPSRGMELSGKEAPWQGECFVVLRDSTLIYLRESAGPKLYRDATDFVTTVGALPSNSSAVETKSRCCENGSS